MDMYWGTKILGNNIIHLTQIDSTNNYIKRIYNDSLEDGTLVIADYQTAGRGQSGHIWESNNNKGIWMSLLLKRFSKLSPEKIQMITFAASICVINAIKKTTGINALMKWPNDVMIDGKKVCGVLTEANFSGLQLNYIIVGIGLNLYHGVSDFSTNIRDIATSIETHIDLGMNTALLKYYMIKEILVEFEQLYNKIDSGYTEELFGTYHKHIIKEIHAYNRKT